MKLALLAVFVPSLVLADEAAPPPAKIAGPPPKKQEPPRLHIGTIHAAAGIAGKLYDTGPLDTALDGPKVDAALKLCAPSAGATLLAWVVFERGRPTTVDVGGTSTPKVATCTKRAFKEARIDDKQRIVLAVELTADAGGEAPPVDSSVSADQIQAVMRRSSASFRALEATPKFAGRARARFEIQPDGSVKNAKVEATDAPILTACLETQLGKLRFPAAAKSSSVNFPFVFASK